MNRNRPRSDTCGRLVDKNIKAGITSDFWPNGVTGTEFTLLSENKTGRNGQNI